MRIRRADHTILSAVNLDEAALASSYNALLESDSQLAAETWDRLHSQQRERGLRVGDRFLCDVMRPRFLTADRTDELTRISEAVARLMERAGEQLLRRPDLLQLIGASEQEQEIWAIDPGYPGFTLTSRLDSFMVGRDPRFIEYNAESPAGIAFVDILAEIFVALPALARWTDRERLTAMQARKALLETVLWAYREWGGRGSPVVAIVDWKDVITRRDFEIAADYFRNNGITTIITDPRQIEYRGGAVLAEGERVDLIYRRVLLHELLNRAAEAADLVRAYRDGAVCVVNSPRSKLLHKKALFALLSDGHLELHETAEEQSMVERCIPWTRIMEPGPTTFHHETVDLGRFLVQNQERLALKPIDEYGGRGVALGWDMSREEWVEAIEIGFAEPYVVQERVPVAHGAFPIWEDGEVKVETLLVDTNPLMFRGEVGGILTRTSSEALLNVSAGTGSSTATFIVGA